jgi:hypothetical protein
MSAWRCPNCGTLQAESHNCFLCGRSATSCATCINFRESLVGGVGYCALDKKREPLTGGEQRTCWTGETASALAPVTPDRAFGGLLDVLDGPAVDARAPRGALRPVSGQ